MRKKKTEANFFDFSKKLFLKNEKFIFVGKLLQKAYRQFPDKIALVDNDRSITYKEFYFRSILLSEYLKSMQIAPGEKIMIFCENSVEFCVYYFASWQIGAVVIPVNIFLHEKELQIIINDSQPKIVLTTENFRVKFDNLKNKNLLDTNPTILTQEVLDWNSPIPPRIEDLYPDFRVQSLEQKDLCLILYTSGTTGKPKGVMLSSENIMTNLMQAYARLKLIGLKDNERFFCVIPLFHVFAQNMCFWVPILTGGSSIIVKRIERKLILKQLQQKPTVFIGVPALYGLLCLMKTAPLDSVKIFVSGADALPDKIRAAFAAVYGRRICAGYGLTEASPLVSIDYSNGLQSTNVIGHPVAELEYEIRDEKMNALKKGGIGNLWLKGKNIMVGYYNDENATSKVLCNGWLNTGDIASIQKNGMIAIRGRTKDLIINKGFNIYPQEIENVLMSHPTIFKAAVIGKDEETVGQVPIAFVAVKKMDNSLEGALRDLCRNNLAAYKIPKKFICLEDLPMNATGKVDKKQLRNL
jgi:long-chain acyl-CoA synthetase